MVSYVTPKKGVEYITYITLPSVASSNIFQVNPTIAAGDFKVSIDGGAEANLATLPAVTPAGGKRVKITLSTSEMNGDNISVIGSDAAGGEWKDVHFNIQTSARQIDDLAYPTTSGRSIDVTAGGEVGIDWANIGSPTTTVSLSGTTVKTATDVETDTADIQSRLPAALVSGRIDASVGAIEANAITAASMAADASAEIADAVWDEDATGHQTQGSFGQVIGDSGADSDSIWALANTNLDAAVSSRASQASLDTVDDFLDTEIAAILADTNELQTDWANGGRLDLILDSAASAGDPWATALPGAYGAGTAGKIVGDNLNATVSSRASQTSLDTVDGIVDDILLDTAEIGAAGAGLTNINLPDQTMNIVGNITGNLSGSVGSVTAAVTLPTIPTNWLTADGLAADAVTEIQSGLSTLTAAGIRTAVGLASANLDTQLDALPTANENADALLDRSNGVETGITPRQALRLKLAALAGKLSGAATTSIVIRDANDTKDRITATVDSNGNRSAVTLDAT